MKHLYSKFIALLLMLAVAPMLQAQVDKNQAPKDEDPVYVYVEEQPSFPGGDDAMYAFLAKHIEYPHKALENGITGTVYASFIVQRDGTISDITIRRDIGAGCGAEVVRVIKMMPRWNPGRQKGKPVRCQFILPVKFNLSD